MGTFFEGTPDARAVVLVGIDFSEEARRALDAAKTLAKKSENAELHLVHVLPVPSGDGAAEVRATRMLQYTDLIDDARRELDALAAQAASTGIRVSGHIRVGRPAVEIAQLASDLAADLVVVGTHGRNGINRLLLGSVAEGLVRHAPCPVLAVRPKAPTASELIEPPCPDCVAVQRETKRAQLWCARHSAHHQRAHTYYEYPESFAVGSQTFR
jgi:nucleotide-binding universal stress UspA family protein